MAVTECYRRGWQPCHRSTRECWRVLWRHEPSTRPNPRQQSLVTKPRSVVNIKWHQHFNIPRTHSAMCHILMPPFLFSTYLLPAFADNNFEISKHILESSKLKVELNLLSPSCVTDLRWSALQVSCHPDHSCHVASRRVVYWDQCSFWSIVPIL